MGEQAGEAEGSGRLNEQQVHRSHGLCARIDMETAKIAWRIGESMDGCIAVFHCPFFVFFSLDFASGPFGALIMATQTSTTNYMLMLSACCSLIHWFIHQTSVR